MIHAETKRAERPDRPKGRDRGARLARRVARLAPIYPRRRTGVFAYSTNYLIDVENAIIVDVEPTAAIDGAYAFPGSSGSRKQSPPRPEAGVADETKAIVVSA